MDDELMQAIKEVHPEDTDAEITEWYNQAVEYDQPLRVKEYTDYRRYNEVGNLTGEHHGTIYDNNQ